MRTRKREKGVAVFLSNDPPPLFALIFLWRTDSP